MSRGPVSEANDLSVRVARTVTGNTGFIVTQNAYHGVTATIAEMSPTLGKAIKIASHVRTVPAPDTYRADCDQVSAKFTRDVEAAIGSLAERGIRPAGIMFDTVFAGDGLFGDPPGFIAGAVAAVRKAGGLYIADEVQGGLARPGTHMWAFERHGIVPDLVTVGKTMGDGHPLAAMLARPELLADFGEKTRYFNIFGGNPVSTAVGHAVLDVIENEKLMDNSHQVGAYLRKKIDRLKDRYSTIGDVRSIGLYIGVEMVSDQDAKTPSADLAARYVNQLRRDGVLVGICGVHANVIKIRPPLVFTEQDADVLLERMDAAFKKL